MLRPVIHKVPRISVGLRKSYMPTTPLHSRFSAASSAAEANDIPSSSHLASSAPRNPLIAILGPTGTGKSDLAISLATSPLSPLAHRSEIINADALQLYSGLPIATNQIPLSERQGVPHHLLGCVPLTERPWTVQKYLAEASRAIEDVRRRGKTPIVVGGTGYYLQALCLGGGTVGGAPEAEHGDTEYEERQDGGAVPGAKADLSAEEEESKWPILGQSAEEMLEELRRVDPVMARRWHPNDRRKIRRSLAIWLQTGRTASEIYAEQKQKREALAGSKNGVPSIEREKDGEENVSSGSPTEIAKHDTLFFYLHAHSPSLEDRLEKRVENMLARGLLDEIRRLRFLHDELVRVGNPPDVTRGIWVAIGYKEFTPYLDALEASETGMKKQSSSSTDATSAGVTNGAHYSENSVEALEDESLRARQAAKPEDPYFLPCESAQLQQTEKSSSGQSNRNNDISVLRKQGIDRMVVTTRQYARSQRKWLRGQLRSAILQHTGSLENLYILDASSPASFSTTVCGNAFDIVSRFLQAEDLPKQEEIFEGGKKVLGGADGTGAELRESRECEVCGVVVMREEDWLKHGRSTKHRRAVKRKRREKERGERERRLAVRFWKGDKDEGENGVEDEWTTSVNKSGEEGAIVGLGGLEMRQEAMSEDDDGIVARVQTLSTG